MRRRLAIALWALLVAAGAVWLVPADARMTAVSDSGPLDIVQRGDASSFHLTDLIPGQSGDGDLTLSNAGLISGDLRLAASRIEDMSGGRLSEALLLTVTEGDRVLYEGTLRGFSRLDLGTLGARSERRFHFHIAFPESSREENALAGNRVEVDFAWTVGDGAPAEEPKAAGEVAGSSSTGVIIEPVGRSCVSRRRFRIRVRVPHGFGPVRRARVFVNGKRVRVIRGRRIRAVIDLRGMPRGRATVRIVLTGPAGRRATGVRRYRTCTARRPSHRAPKV